MSVDENNKHDDLEEILVDDIEQDAEQTTAEQEDVSTDASPQSDSEQIEQLQNEIGQWKDAALRSEAEMQNIRRRSQKDVENAHKFANEKFIKELLPVIDNLERALENTDTQDEAVKGMVAGVEMTLKSFTTVLEKFNVIEVNPVGEPFDPKLHQAMTMISQPDAEPNSVISVMQKGYELSGRLIRPAMVVVNKS